MAIIKYTTKIEVSQSIGEIQGMLAKAGASRVSVDYGIGSSPRAITFMLPMEESAAHFRLPSRTDGVLRCLMKSNAPKRLKTMAQAERVGWRIIRSWVEAQIALIELQMAEAAEVFLPYAQLPGGSTFYNHLKTSHEGKLLLSGGRG